MVKETENQEGFWTTSLGKTLSFLGKYTGISWILGKISSGWNWLFGGNDESQANAAKPKSETLKQPKGKGPAQQQSLGAYLTLGGSTAGLQLTVNRTAYNDAKDSYRNGAAENEFCMFIKILGKEFRVTGRYDSQQDLQGSDRATLDINSIVKKSADGKYMDSDAVDPKNENTESMQKLLNITDKKTKSIQITEISNAPFKAPKVVSSGPAAAPVNPAPAPSAAPSPAGTLNSTSAKSNVVGNGQPTPGVASATGARRS